MDGFLSRANPTYLLGRTSSPPASANRKGSTHKDASGGPTGPAGRRIAYRCRKHRKRKLFPASARRRAEAPVLRSCPLPAGSVLVPIKDKPASVAPERPLPQGQILLHRPAAGACLAPSRKPGGFRLAPHLASEALKPPPSRDTAARRMRAFPTSILSRSAVVGSCPHPANPGQDDVALAVHPDRAGGEADRLPAPPLLR